MPRGLINNNPGNIVKSNTVFQGEVKGSDVKFKTFTDMEHGYRAIFKILRTYIKMGNNTITKIINRYAPSVENNTTAYIRSVEVTTGIKKDTVIGIDDADSLIKIVAAISQHENGVKADVSKVIAGWNLVDGVKKK